MLIAAWQLNVTGSAEAVENKAAMFPKKECRRAKNASDDPDLVEKCKTEAADYICRN